MDNWDRCGCWIVPRCKGIKKAQRTVNPGLFASLVVSNYQTMKANIGRFQKGHASSNKTHNESGHKDKPATKEYNTWVRIKARCYNKKNQKFRIYGGRGITMCDRWISSYEVFLADMGRAPSRQHSIDRINNDGNYEPSNCRWATVKIQNYNQQKTLKFEYHGKMYTLFELSLMHGIPRRTLYDRLCIKKKWSIEDAITAPIGTYLRPRSTIYKNGHTCNLGKKYNKD